VGHQDSETHIPDAYEEVVGAEDIITLTARQYCVVLNPVEEGVPQLGKKRLEKGPKNFFLLPGEILEENKIKEAIVLMAEQALNVRATEEFMEVIPTSQTATVNKRRCPGDRWLVCGPREYVPPVGVEIISRRTAIIQLEGMNIYIFNVGGIIVGFILLLLIIYFAITFRSGGLKFAKAEL